MALRDDLTISVKRRWEFSPIFVDLNDFLSQAELLKSWILSYFLFKLSDGY